MRACSATKFPGLSPHVVVCRGCWCDWSMAPAVAEIYYMHQRPGAATCPGPASRKAPRLLAFIAGLASKEAIECGSSVEVWAPHGCEAMSRGRYQPTLRPSCSEVQGVLGDETPTQRPTREHPAEFPSGGFTLVMYPLRSGLRSRSRVGDLQTVGRSGAFSGCHVDRISDPGGLFA